LYKMKGFNVPPIQAVLVCPGAGPGGYRGRGDGENMSNLFPYQIQEAVRQQAIPWNIQQVQAPSFWGKTKGRGAVVAIIDTGLDVTHPEFAGRIISPRNFTTDGYNTSIVDVTDREGHGTHVSGIIAGRTTGVAPEARIMPIKVFGPGDGFAFQDAFRHVIGHNKTAPEQDRVVAVNCSWGGPYDPIVHFLIRQLVESGVVVVVSAGNAGDGKADTAEIFSWPGFLWEPITVGATNQDGQPAGYSSSYDGIDIGAPGTQIYSAWPGGGYKLLSGTSMSAPHVTGAVALIYAAYRMREGRYPTSEEAEAILFRHVRKVDIDDAFVGQGILDLTNQIKTFTMDVPPVIEGRRTLTPARYVAELLGAKVNWYAGERRVEIIGSGEKLDMWIGSKQARITRGISL